MFNRSTEEMKDRCPMSRCTLPFTSYKLIFICYLDMLIFSYLYPLREHNLYSLLSIICFHNILSDYYNSSGVGTNTGWANFYLWVVMAKEKGKLLFNEILCTPASQANKVVNQAKANVTPTALSSVNDEKAVCKPKIMLQSEKTKGKLVVDSKTLFEKLAAARAKAKKTKELTLMACLIGKFLEFPKIFTKLRMDWRFIKGEILFHDQKNGWFEIVFSNPLDLTKIWENRPYHIGGQLLLLKPWLVDFDPLTEPISCLDLWVRIFKLPNEYKNPEALSAILEANVFGNFIRLDPIHLKRKWVKFVRLCVNTDVEVTTGQKIIIPDENMVEHKYNVWFDDFPVGCGNCGDINHVFNECPDKTPTPPTITITLKKPSSKAVLNDEIEGWTRVGLEKGQSSKPMANPHGHKPYLVENAGIDVVSEDSTDQGKTLSGESEEGGKDLPNHPQGDEEPHKERNPKEATGIVAILAINVSKEQARPRPPWSGVRHASPGARLARA